MGHTVISPSPKYTDTGTRDAPRRAVVPLCAEMVLRVLVFLLACCCLVSVGKVHSHANGVSWHARNFYVVFKVL